MRDCFRDRRGKFTGGDTPWSFQKGHPSFYSGDKDKNALCWEMMNWLLENIQEPELIENDFNRNIVQIWFMIMNYSSTAYPPTRENVDCDTRIVKFFSYIQCYMPEEMRDREMYKSRLSDKELLETFEHWFFECKQKLQNYLTQQFFTKGRMKDLEILKRRYKENWSEQKMVEAKVDAEEKVDGNITINIKDA